MSDEALRKEYEYRRERLPGEDRAGAGGLYPGLCEGLPEDRAGDGEGKNGGELLGKGEEGGGGQAEV